MVIADKYSLPAAKRSSRLMVIRTVPVMAVLIMTPFNETKAVHKARLTGAINMNVKCSSFHLKRRQKKNHDYLTGTETAFFAKLYKK